MSQNRSLLNLLPRRSAVIVALIGVWCGLRYVVAHETPVGRIEGRITLADSRRVMPGAEVTLSPHYGRGHEDDDEKDDNKDVRKTRRAVSDATGHFVLNNIPTGEYELSASSDHHDATAVRISVEEGHSTPILLDLVRNEPALAVKLHQRVYSTDERSHLSISGYVDSARPPHRDTVQITVYRTRLSNVLRNAPAAGALEEVGRGYDAAPKLPSTLLKPGGTTAPTPLWRRDERIQGEDLEGFYYQDIDLSHLGAGLYLIDLKHGYDTACTWVLVTDTALILKRAPQQSLAFVTDMKTGAPVADSEVLTYANGKVLSRSRTDRRGLAAISSSPDANGQKEDQRHLTTVALRGQDEAVVAKDWYQSEDNQDYVVHAYTDRTIYRPGQHINFKAIIRRKVQQSAGSALDPDLKNGAEVAARYTVPTNLPVRVELRDKSGERVLDRQYTTNRYGSIFGAADLLTEATTGAYTLILHVDGEEHTQDVNVASYHKPEFSVMVQPDKPRYMQGERVTVTLAGSYYFGSPVAGAKVKYNVYRSPDWASQFPDSQDTDDEEAGGDDASERSESYYGGFVMNGAATLDANGHATLQFPAQGPEDAKPDDAKNDSRSDSDTPQDMIYTVHATVTEGEDREVEADGEVRVVQGDFRLTASPAGYLALPGQPTNVVLIARDYDGKPIANQPVSLEAGYERWKNDVYQYTKFNVQSAVTGANGEVVAPVTPPKSGQVRLIARAQDGAHRVISAHADLWAARDSDSDLDTTYNDLSLLTDQRRYQPGQTARVLINAARVGETVLLTVEGDRVYHAETFAITQRSTTVRVPILEAYGPNAFLSACYVRDKHFCNSEAPLRVSLPDSAIRVSIRADRDAPTQQAAANTGGLARYAPGDPVTYYVTTTDSKGRPVQCEFSLGVVDESLYALREDDPKALRNAFYPRRTNSVTTLYSFAAEYLGDADKSEPQIAARRKFLDTAAWMPDLQTDRQGQAAVRIILPDNLTTWRATVTAQTLDTKVGRSIRKIIVTKPFFVRLETPRTLTQRDQSQFVALVHNETGQTQRSRVHLQATGLTIGGAAEQELTIAPGAIGTASFPVTAEAFGAAKLKVTAWTLPNATGIRYTDGIETTLPVRAHGMESAEAFAGELTAANPETEVVRLDPNVVPGSARLTVHITPSVGTALAGSLEYLIGYPYGCVEQTMSRLLPDMQAQRALQLHGLPALPQQDRLPQMVREGLQRLTRFQHPTGAWGWWEHDPDDAWMTAYVLYGLHTAQSLGYPVSPQVFAHGREAALKMIRKVKPNQRPFMLYALALCGEREAVARERRDLMLNSVDPEGLAYLALLDSVLGRSPSKAWELLSQRAIDADSAIHWREGGRWDADAETATAVAFRAMLNANRNDARIPSVLRWLMRQRTGDCWTSTRDTSVVLTALCDYLTAMDVAGANGSVRVQLNGREVGSYQLTDSNLKEQDLTLRIPGQALRSGKNDVTLVREGGSSVVFYTVELRQTVAAEDAAPVSAGNLRVSREYLKLVSRRGTNASWALDAEKSDNHFESGQPIRVRLTIDAPRDMDYVLIEDAFPAGCEVNERGDADDVTEWGYWWSSVDVRDDRIAFFVRTLEKGKHVVEYNLRAQTPGSYHTLPTLVQPMYAPDLKALSAEARIEVK